MLEKMSTFELNSLERERSGTSWTRNEEFDKNGYLLIKNLWDPNELYRPVPLERGRIKYWGKKIHQFDFFPVEEQVPGSLAVYSHPQYRTIHSQVRLKLEKIIGRKLYNTYYYDRFYFSGHGLDVHLDRDACEISVSIHISTNLEECWPLWIKTPDERDENNSDIIINKGENRFVCLEPGDGMLYKGCERPHWRDPIPSRHKESLIRKVFKKEDNTYYHQVFFHYVLADGIRAHCADDLAKKI